MNTVGILHPGAMGGGIAAFLAARGNEVLWVGENRSIESRKRAESGGLTEVPTLRDLVDRTELILSICPPEYAGDVAKEVVDVGFHGTYCDANSIAPATAESIATLVEGAGMRFVDGGIIGNPPPGAKTHIFFSGQGAETLAELFAGDDAVGSRALTGPRTSASALKMSYASWTKGSQALVLAVRAAAKASGIEDELLNEWNPSQASTLALSEFAKKNTGKSWRFAGEMREIAKFFAASGVTPAFHEGAAQVFESSAELKNQPSPGMDEVLKLVANSAQL